MKRADVVLLVTPDAFVRYGDTVCFPFKRKTTRISIVGIFWAAQPMMTEVENGSCLLEFLSCSIIDRWLVSIRGPGVHPSLYRYHSMFPVPFSTFNTGMRSDICFKERGVLLQAVAFGMCRQTRSPFTETTQLPELLHHHHFPQIVLVLVLLLFRVSPRVVA